MCRRRCVARQVRHRHHLDHQLMKSLRLSNLILRNSSINKTRNSLTDTKRRESLRNRLFLKFSRRLKKRVFLPILPKMSDEQQNWDQVLENLGRPGGEDVRGAMLGKNWVTMDVPRQGAAQMVQGQLGRVSGNLESKLSPDESAALQPLVDEVAAHPQGTAPAKAAYQKLFEAIYQKFAPLFKAAGSTRRNRTDFDGIAQS